MREGRGVEDFLGVTVRRSGECEFVRSLRGVTVGCELGFVAQIGCYM